MAGAWTSPRVAEAAACVDTGGAIIGATQRHSLTRSSLHAGHNGPHLPARSPPPGAAEAPDTIAQQTRKDTRP